MRSLVEATWQTDDELKEGEPVMKKGKFWLLHFALKYDIIDMGEKRFVPVNYTVCICQDCETGQLREFSATQLRILGTELKK